MFKLIKHYSTTSKKHTNNLLKSLNINPTSPLKGCSSQNWFANGPVINAINPSTNQILAEIQTANENDLLQTLEQVKKAQKEWRLVPAPKRAEILYQLKHAIFNKKDLLASVIGLEMGKIKNESLGEVQEILDILTLSIGLGRTQNGSLFPSERPKHLLMEQWHPLGIVGVISAFNFPMAVYGWNMALALICGNGVVWKPAPTGMLSAISLTNVIQDVLERNGIRPALCSLVCGGTEVGKALVNSREVPLISFTGSTEVGREVGMQVQQRFGKSILELGGNNAMIVDKSADLDMAVSSAFFAAVGTTGQRCTSLRRIFVHEQISDKFMSGLMKGYESLKEGKVGDPLAEGVLLGPLHTKSALEQYYKTIKQVKEEGGEILFGDGLKPKLSQSAYHSQSELEEGNFVMPIVTRVHPDANVLKHETFVPIVHVVTYKTLQEAIHYNNQVSQGLSSSLFTNNLESIYEWLSVNGSDCGIVNVNMPTNGAEIGGAFGGEKETGGGRESGSDSWKQYCRRQTVGINFGKEVQLAQGIKFGV